jgi:hypothetical protein
MIYLPYILCQAFDKFITEHLYTLGFDISLARLKCQAIDFVLTIAYTDLWFTAFEALVETTGDSLACTYAGCVAEVDCRLFADADRIAPWMRGIANGYRKSMTKPAVVIGAFCYIALANFRHFHDKISLWFIILK